jgi:hypothetical protein
MTNVVFENDTEEILETEEPKCSHIVDRGNDERTAQDLVLEAFVNGTMLTALCGHKWIPSRDPKKYPVCQKCIEIYEFAKDFRGV